MFPQVIVLGNLKYPGTPRGQVQDFSSRCVLTPRPGVFPRGQPREIITQRCRAFCENNPRGFGK
jgi:hypothetical protein